MPKTSKVISGTVIKVCTCPNEYQDRKYGAGMRLFNLAPKGKGGPARCTVCGRNA